MTDGPTDAATTAAPHVLAGVPVQGRRVRLERLAVRHMEPLHRMAAAGEVVDSWPLLGKAIGIEELWDHLWRQSSLQFAIVRCHSGEVVGLVQGVDEDLRSGTIGVGLLIDPALWRSGWPLEGMVLFLDYLFDGLGCRKVYVHVPASTLAQLGDGALGTYLTREAVYTRHLRNDGGYEDLHVLALHRQQWEATRAQVPHASGDNAVPRTLGFDEFVDALRQRLYLDLPDDAAATLGLFEDLMLDSLEVYELVVTVEELAAAGSPPEDLPPVWTLGDVYAYYTGLVPS